MFFVLPEKNTYAQPCDLSTPTYNLNLTGVSDSIWESPNEARDGFCCSASGSDRCIEFIVTLDPGALGIQFNIAAGAVPPGALFYEIECANPTQVGDTLCLDGVGPHRITFCKPGNNKNIYEIVSVEAPGVSPAITVSDGCSGLIHVNGYDETTVNWAPVPFNAEYVNYMSCTSGCDTVLIAVTQPGYPSFIDFEVSGYPPFNLCDTAIVRDTVRVYFVTDKFVEILPANPVVCFGGTNTTITANPSGGAPPYSYLWNTGETAQSIDVGVGTYWVEVFDTTNCPTVLDTVIVTAHLSPISVNAGLDVSSCTNLPTAAIAGTVNIADGGIWTGGAGSYSPSNTALSTNYTPTPAEIIAGSVTLTLTTTGNDGCPAESDLMTITIEPAPIIDAGVNQVVCGDISSVSLSGTFSNAGGVIWSSSGTGTFGNLNNPVTTYSPSTADTAAGGITLTLTTTLTGACASVSDIVNITFTPIPVVNANIDQTVCSDVSSVSLGGTVTVANGGNWTTNGTGSFSPNATTLTASYIPSALDAITGNVTLTLTSTGNGTCNAYNDQMIITFYAAPTVAVGADQTVCADIGTVTLSPTTANAVSYLWSSSGSGTFSPNNITETADYIPSNADTANGNITLTLTVISAGCSNYSDDLNLTITTAPTVTAGTDITTCKDISAVTLSGAVSVATGGTWTSSGTGTFSPSANSLGGNYIPSAADTAAGSVTLTLTTTGNGSCNAYTDNVFITFTDIPTVNAGIDQTICADIANVPLGGAITIATGGTWATSGTGTFTPGNTSLGGAYIPSNSDTTAGTVTLTLTTAGNGFCNAYNDQMIITISPSPIVSAGTDQTLCSDVGTVGLNGTVINAAGGSWTTSGNGTFSPNNNTLNASYLPTSSDTLNGSVTLTLTTTGNGTCNAYADDMLITFTTAPTVNAGTDINTCKDIASIALNGSVTIATGGAWTTSGSGTFNPNANTLTASYIPSAADTAAGTITLTLTTNGNGLCNVYSDNVVITLTNIPTVDAGIDQTICADATGAFLAGSVTIATGGTWATSGTGTFSPSNTALGATYIPSDADTTAGTVTLTLTTTGNGLCQAYSDQMTVTISPAPIANANVDQTVCGDIAAVPLNGSVITATVGSWTTSGTGTFSPDNLTLNASYVPTTADTIAGSVTLTLTTTGNGTCNAYADDMLITFTTAPTVNAGTDINTCKDIASIALNGSVTIATGGAWTTSGSGTFNPNANTLTASYIPSAADTAAGTITLTLTTNGNGLCNVYSDNVVITLTNIPTVDAGIDQTICADATGAFLAGSVTIATGGTWATSGTGTFSPSNTALGATYIPSDADTTAGTVTLTLTTAANGLCQAYSDQMTVTISPATVASANVDQTVCGDIAAISLNGSVITAAGGTWTTSGTGTFSPDNLALNASYVPTTADTIAGSVTLTLTTTGNGTCNAYTDDMLITFTTAPTVNAGTDITTCKDITSIALNGYVTIATGGTWTTSGSGTFNPNATTLTASYIPSAADTAAGTITLTLTTTGNGLCNVYSDNVVITLTNIPTVDAGIDQTICADATGAFLAGSVTIATGGTWATSGTGTFSPSNTTLGATYIPSDADTTAGTVTLTLTTTGNGLCQAYSDQMTVTISPAPIANANVDQTVCGDIAAVPLNGSVITATGGSWTTSGTGTFSPDNLTLNASYVPTTADTIAGSVTLTLTTTGNGTCNAYTDDMLITFTTAPTVNAGTDITTCKDITSIALNGSVTIATGGAWTTSGSGTFNPNATTLTASYIPSAADTATGGVTLTLTTTGNGLCNAYSDNVVITLTDIPVSLASSDQTVCADISGVSLNGGVLNAIGGIWSTNGTGIFTPSDSDLNATYVPSAGDTVVGNVTLALTTTGNGLCNAYNDLMNITIIPAPIAYAGNDTSVCSTNPVVPLGGSVITATGGIWTTNGSGTFTPNDTDLNAIYETSLSDQTIGTVQIYLTTTGNGLCNAVTDTINLTITPTSITVFVGNDTLVCGDDSLVLNASITTATGGIWSTLGDGLFSDTTDLNASYFFGPNDTVANTVRLILNHYWKWRLFRHKLIRSKLTFKTR